MTSLFSDAGRRRLDQIVRDRVLCAFDFDGTLAPIVPRPEDARLPDDVMQHLLALSAYAPVAIVTGRSVDDIRQRLGFTPDFTVGNHGAEGVPGGESNAARHQALCASWLTQISRALQGGTIGGTNDDANGGLDAALRDSGIQVEDKRYSLSVHYRMATDPERAASALRKLFARIEPPPRIVSGKCVFNVVPEDAPNKGSALERLIAISGARGAIYVGDDVTDEDVFRLRRPDLLSVRVERSAQTAAEFFLPQLQDILALLSDLSARLQAQHAVNWMRPGSGSAG